jgi:hypothetical protein
MRNSTVPSGLVCIQELAGIAATALPEPTCVSRIPTR